MENKLQIIYFIKNKILRKNSFVTNNRIRMKL